MGRVEFEPTCHPSRCRQQMPRSEDVTRCATWLLSALGFSDLTRESASWRSINQWPECGFSAVGHTLMGSTWSLYFAQCVHEAIVDREGGMSREDRVTDFKSVVILLHGRTLLLEYMGFFLWVMRLTMRGESKHPAKSRKNAKQLKCALRICRNLRARHQTSFEFATRFLARFPSPVADSLGERLYHEYTRDSLSRTSSEVYTPRVLGLLEEFCPTDTPCRETRQQAPAFTLKKLSEELSFRSFHWSEFVYQNAIPHRIPSCSCNINTNEFCFRHFDSCYLGTVVSCLHVREYGLFAWNSSFSITHSCFFLLWAACPILVKRHQVQII